MRRQRRFGFALMGVAGWCDACAIILFANLFVSFQSGDAVQLGKSVADGAWHPAAKFLGAQAAFVLGAALGRFMRVESATYGRRISLVCMSVLLGLTAAFGTMDTIVPAYAFAAVAMGIQNATMTHEGDVLIGTMVTGTLARLGFAVADRAMGTAGGGNIADNLGQWSAFVAGAFAGACCFHLIAANAFWIPALIHLLLIPAAAKLPRIIPHPKIRAA